MHAAQHASCSSWHCAEAFPLTSTGRVVAMIVSPTDDTHECGFILRSSSTIKVKMRSSFIPSTQED